LFLFKDDEPGTPSVSMKERDHAAAESDYLKLLSGKSSGSNNSNLTLEEKMFLASAEKDGSNNGCVIH
jgi:hypothetical protein